MASNSSATLVFVLTACLISTRAVHAVRAQAPGQSLIERCGIEQPEHSTMAAIRAALATKEKSDALAALDAIETPVRTAALAAPRDVSAQFHLAALLGARADLEGGRKKIAAAQEMHPIALRVMAIEPDHAGANYLMGRLHAGVMRLDRVTRFLATHLLGGGALKDASWDVARQSFEAAERAAPCVPEHHYELARLYVERKQREAGELERLHVLDVTARDPARWSDIRTKASRVPLR